MIVSVNSGKLRLKLGLQKNRNLEEIPASLTRKLLMKIMNGVYGITINYHRSFIIMSYFGSTLTLLLWNKGIFKIFKNRLLQRTSEPRKAQVKT
jgi:hypothetical protein